MTVFSIFVPSRIFQLSRNQSVNSKIPKSTGSDTWRIELKYVFPGPQRLRTLLLLYLLINKRYQRHLSKAFLNIFTADATTILKLLDFLQTTFVTDDRMELIVVTVSLIHSR